MDELLGFVAVGGARVEAAVADLTAQRVDAIVNAANSALVHGGGVAGAIVRGGGDVIQRESARLAPVAVGDAVATSAGRLPSRWVIHAVGPRWGEGDEEGKLRRAVTRALAVAQGLGAGSIALPAISTGIFGMPKSIGCKVIVEAVREVLEAGAGSLRLVRLVDLDPATVACFRDNLSAVEKE